MTDTTRTCETCYYAVVVRERATVEYRCELDGVGRYQHRAAAYVCADERWRPRTDTVGTIVDVKIP